MADKNKGGRPRKFKSAKELDDAIKYYFDSITKSDPLFDNVLVGYEDEEKKKPIYDKVPVLNNAGEQITRTTYFEHPSILGLANFLGTTRKTLLDYENMEEFSYTIKKAKEKIESYLEDQLYRRDQVTGIIFNLKNNFSWKDKQELEHSGGMVIFQGDDKLED